MSTKLLVTAAIGAVVGVGVGYALFALHGSRLNIGLIEWLTDRYYGGPKDAVLWAILGAAVAVGLRYLTSPSAKDH